MNETYETVPLQPLPSQRVKCVLNGQQCDIFVYDRGGRLFLDLAVSGVDIGLGMVCQNLDNMPVWATADFKGKLRFIDTVNSSDPDYEGLGERHILLYVPPEKLAQEEAEAVAVGDPFASLAQRFLPPNIRSYAAQDDPD